MNRSQLVALADAIQSLRPDWQQPGIIAALDQLERTWSGTDAGLYVHAMAIAGNPVARTPQAFNATPAATPTPPARPLGRQEQCYICGRTRSMCDMVRAKEHARGIPDPHQFETIEYADANRARNQIDARIRAKADIAEARRQVAYVPDPDPPEPRTCSGCGGTLAQDEHDRHPGCEQETPTA